MIENRINGGGLNKTHQFDVTSESTGIIEVPALGRGFFCVQFNKMPSSTQLLSAPERFTATMELSIGTLSLSLFSRSSSSSPVLDISYLTAS
jgi:hypothetical protein